MGDHQDSDGKTTSTMVPNPALEFRCDCPQAQFYNASVTEVEPGVKA